MMGRNDKPQKPLFYSFNLDDLVPQDHLLRQIDRFLDLSDLREHLAPFYSHTGRPSVDPELMIRMLIIGYCLGIRSERRLCEEVKLNMAYWSTENGLKCPGNTTKTSKSGTSRSANLDLNLKRQNRLLKHRVFQHNRPEAEIATAIFQNRLL